MDLETKIIRHIKKNISNEYEDNIKDNLPEESILESKVKGFKNLPIESLSIVFEADQEEINSINWDTILNTLKEEIIVKYEPGKGLIDDSEEYNKLWFTNIKKTTDFDPYYIDRFNDRYKEILGPQVRYTLGKDTESILNLCGAPNRETVKHVRGLVFGFVQSGKTLNYASVANAAMGAGYDMIVILAGATNILREQTQDRLNHDLIGQSSGKRVGVGLFENIPAKKPISLTTLDSDFNTREANAQTNGINLENIKVPVIAVIKKNVTPIKNIKDWLEKQSGHGGIIKKSLLLIDDESDYASVNTKKEEDPTSINKGIRNLLNIFDVSTYLAVTATPFANIFIDHEVTNEEYGSDLFPRSFIWALDKPETYVGVSETLGDNFIDVYSLNNELKDDEINDNLRFVLTAKKDDEFKKLPYYVKYAVCKFFYDTTCLRKDKKKLDHLSMLVNISRFTNHHIEISSLLQEFTDNLYKIIRNSSIYKIKNKWLLHIKSMATAELNSFESIERFWEALELNLGMTEVFDIHQKTKIPLTYPKGLKRNSLLVGGLSLSRGYTIEGLITSVFLRTTKTFDTLMQMGRWFGHKRNILKYISVYTTPTIRNRFELIEESISDLLEQIEEMKRLKLPPKEFGLHIRRHPNVVIESAVKELRSRQGLEVVSRNKMKAAKRITLKLSLGARVLETVRFLNDYDSNFYNNNLVIDFFHKLNENPNCNKYTPSKFPNLNIDIKNKNRILGFLDTPNDLVKEFIMNFKIPPQKISDTNAKLPLRFLLEFLNKDQNKDLLWDVSLVSGGEKDSVAILEKKYNKVKRSLEISKDGESIKIPKNQLSIPAHEFRFLTENYNEMKNRSWARSDRKTQTSKPLLLLYPIRPEASKGESLDLSIYNEICLWGWSISMPGNSHEEDYISVIANTVLFEQLQEEYKEEFEYEDY